MLNDFRYVIRSLLRSPGFSATVVFTLALAIGASSAVFAICNAVLFPPLGFERPDTILRVIGTSSSDSRYDAVSYPDFADVVAESGVFTVILVAAFLAASIPAWRAANTDPIAVIHAE